MRTIFTLASGRSGTNFLAQFFKKNVRDCYAIHEPYVDPYNPTLFGKPIFLNTTNKDEELNTLLEKKANRILGLKIDSYFESNHAILKAANRFLAEYFPDIGLVHLIREPCYVAKSELNREMVIRKTKLPFTTYKGISGESLFRWSLTGYEEIFARFDLSAISRFQFYILQWIEIENRAVTFIKDNKLESRCFRLHVPQELNEAQKLQEMVKYFDLKTNSRLNLSLGKNKTPFAPHTEIDEKDIDEFNAIISKIPQRYLEIFSEAPYNQYSWTKNLISKIS